MIYFSEIKNKTVTTEDGIRIGKLTDVIFLAKDLAPVTKIVVRTALLHDIKIPSQYIKKIGNTVLISKQFQEADLIENELYLVKNLLDKQIIDIEGNKIVRVNDVAIQDKVNFYIAGVDIGILGILRWFNLEDLVLKAAKSFSYDVTSRFLSWGDIQPLELARGRVSMKKELTQLERIRPEDLADYLEQTNIKNVNNIVEMLDEDFAAEVIGNMNINYQNALFQSYSPAKAAKVLSHIDPDEAVDILLTLQKRKRNTIMALLPAKERKDINHLLNLSKTPIGERLTTEYVTVSPDDTARKIIDFLQRETDDDATMYYVYVVNKDRQLVGVFNLHELLMQKLDTPAYKFMVQDVVVIHLTTPEELALKKMLKYRIQALPVIDRTKQILGILSFDDLTELVMERMG
ncbi:CBS domain-containing protein [Candidatus Roizmanbacteria bacterium]|nr:CBS domain-containing protein [Candidatus Roizmanbacteria bacterium]